MTTEKTKNDRGRLPKLVCHNFSSFRSSFTEQQAITFRITWRAEAFASIDIMTDNNITVILLGDDSITDEPHEDIRFMLQNLSDSIDERLDKLNQCILPEKENWSYFLDISLALWVALFGLCFLLVLIAKWSQNSDSWCHRRCGNFASTSWFADLVAFVVVLSLNGLLLWLFIDVGNDSGQGIYTGGEKWRLVYIPLCSIGVVWRLPFWFYFWISSWCSIRTDGDRGKSLGEEEINNDLEITAAASHNVFQDLSVPIFRTSLHGLGQMMLISLFVTGVVTTPTSIVKAGHHGICIDGYVYYWLATFLCSTYVLSDDGIRKAVPFWDQIRRRDVRYFFPSKEDLFPPFWDAVYGAALNHPRNSKWKVSPSVSNTETLPAEPRMWELVLRFVLDCFVNDLGARCIIFGLPLHASTAKYSLEFVLLAVASFYIVQLDNRPRKQFELVRWEGPTPLLGEETAVTLVDVEAPPTPASNCNTEECEGKLDPQASVTKVLIRGQVSSSANDADEDSSSHVEAVANDIPQPEVDVLLHDREE